MLTVEEIDEVIQDAESQIEYIKGRIAHLKELRKTAPEHL
jgi:hypothetical protein